MAEPVGGDLGLEAARAMWAADRASKGLGMELVTLEPGRAVVRMAVRAEMVNGHDMAHGGFVFALADSAFALACNSHGPVTVAAGCDITFVRSAKLGEVLEAEAVERVVFGRSGLTDASDWIGSCRLPSRFARSRSTPSRTPPS